MGVFHRLSLREKHEKQISVGIRMKTTFVFLLAMVMSISGSRIGNSHANAKFGKRIENPAHIAKDFFRAKHLQGDEPLTPCMGAIAQCVFEHKSSTAEEFEEFLSIYAECCRENEEICLSEPKVAAITCRWIIIDRTPLFFFFSINLN